MKLDLDQSDIAAIVAPIVAETLRQRDEAEAKLGDRLGLTEPEAAQAIGVASYVLRDCRRRGEINARLVGRRYVYSKAELLRFIAGGDK